MKPSPHLRRFLFTAGSMLMIAASAQAQSNGTWITDGDASWNTAANWQSNTIADGSGNTAFFTAELTADRIVTLGADRTIGNITFTDGTTSSSNLSITGANTLTLAGTTPTVRVTQSDRALTIGSTISGTSGLTKSGAGTLTLSGINDYTGATIIRGGSLNLTGSLASATLEFTGNGTLQFNQSGTNTQDFSSGGTTLSAGAASVTTTATNTLKLGTITRGSGNTGTINIGDTGTITSANTNSNGIIGGWATHNGSNWAVANGNDSDITGLGTYTTLPTTGGSATVNYRMTATTTLGGSFSVNSLKLEAPSGNLVLGANLLTIESGGLLITGTTERSITGTAGGTRLTAGAGSNYNLIIHQYNSGYASNYGSQITAVIGNNGANAVSVVKAGTGTLALTATNTYTGSTIVQSGRLQATAAGSLGAGSLTLAGGELELKNDSATNFGRNTTVTGDAAIFHSMVTVKAGVIHALGTLSIGEHTLRVRDGFINDNSTGGISFTSTNLTGNATFNVTNNNANSRASLNLGAVSGSGFSLTKIGDGTLILSSTVTSSYTGATNINAGTLQIGDTATNRLANSSRISIAGGATFSANSGGTTNNFVLANNQIVEGTGTGTGNINIGTAAGNSLETSGNNIIRHTGAGTLAIQRLEIRGTGNEMTGGNVQVGIAATRRGLVIGNNNAGTFTISGGTLNSIGGSVIDLIGAASSGSATLNISGGSYNTTAASLGNGSTSNPGGTLNLNSGSATIGTLTYNSNTTGGQSIVNLNGGTLSIGTITSTAGATREFNFNGGQFIATGNVNFASSLTALNVQNGGAFINTNGNSVSVDRALVNNGTGGLTKSGNGTLTLSGANTYTGATSITGGSLVLSGTGSLANSSTITINSSTSLNITGLTGNFTVGTSQSLGGSGTVTATGKTVFANGTLTPGNSPGTLTQDGGTLQLGANGDLNWQVYDADGTAGTGYDTVSLINGAILDLSAIDALNPYNINLWSLSATGPDADGSAIDFNNTLNYAWTLFSTGTAITGFDLSKFDINVGSFNGTTGFTNALNGSFSLALADSNTDLVLTYTAIPEPGAALLGGLGLLVLLRRRR